MAKRGNVTSDQLALVTSASSGIGLELARRLAQNNYDLVIAAEDAGIEHAATELCQVGVNVEPVQVNLATRDGVDRLAGRFASTDADLMRSRSTPPLDSAADSWIRTSTTFST